ncbi:MAG: lipopolysaccharide biosynthesis protein [Saprospiraceae bacterium]
MGVIKSQGIKQSLIVYVGTAIGVISTLLIYPNLPTEEFGLIKFIQDTALLVVPFLYLGSNALSVRYFPIFKNDENGHNGLLTLLLSLLGVGFSIFALICVLFQERILNYYSNLSEEYITYLDYLPYVLPVTFFLSFSGLITQYTMNFQRIAIPAIFNDLFVKLGIPILVLLYLYHFIDLSGVINGMLIVYASIFICLVVYLVSLGQFHLKSPFQKLNRPLVKEMRTYAGYSIFGSLGSQLATRIDTFMVGSLINLSSTGVFAIAFYISNVIDIPRRAISKISSPILSQSLQDGDLENVAKIYKKSALIQLIIGSFIFAGIWLSLDDLFSLMKNGEEFARGKYVVFALGIAILIDMLTGVNDEIIAYSKYYRYKFYLILCLAVFNIVANLIFILELELGIVGAALATLFSKSIYNLIKFILLKVKMDIQPFSINMLWAVGIVIGCYFLVSILPLTDLVFLNIVIKSASFAIICGGLIYGLKISEDVNELVDGALQKVIGFVRK